MADNKEDRMATVLASLLGSQPEERVSRKRKREESQSSISSKKTGRQEVSRKESKDVVNGVHVLPSSSLWAYEKTLKQVAMRGVVQLFNAVNKQQKELQTQLEAVGSSEAKREKVLSSVDKTQFLEMLKSNHKSRFSKTKGIDKQSKKKKNEMEQPNWSILRDDTGLETAMERWEENDGEDL
ncbi:PREDICTED: RRP15-like protein [Amphimedon queenslandica]|uniref:RRP15-like protein n=1 Tax=Amphimedon queenslandica TaxID=400682 RepID=A0A1X7V5V6_AMPQE|nr:PREDICTED: RRP15-like protein [Amphimedon queenslandica]|eukprot:XP_011403174.1 PREDICTED: RRP15-like protein [Amphimedon queenslandica]